MYRLYNRITNETISNVITNHGITIDEAISLVGKIYKNRQYEEDVLINGKWYYYDDIDIEKIA